MRDRKDLIGGIVDPEFPVHHEPDDGDGGHPLVATIVGVIVLLLMSGSSSGRTFGSGIGSQAEMYGYMSGSAVAGAAIVWGIAYAITIRKASKGWKIGSLIAISIASLLSTAIKMGDGASKAFMDDAADIQSQYREIAKDGKDVRDVRIREGKGPLTRMSAAALNPIIADSAAYQQEMERSGLSEVITFEGLTKKSPVLDRCDGFDRLADRARLTRERLAEHFAAARAVGEAAVRAGEMPQSGLTGYEAGARDGRGKLQRQWDVNRMLASEVAARCRILARRNWDKPADAVMFRNDDDLKAFNAGAAKIEAYLAELERHNAESKANLEKWARETG